MGDGDGRILLVEDDRFLRKAVAATLTEHGFAVLLAEDGVQGLEQARTGAPDLILLDLIMPRLSGFEVLRALKQEPATAAIPVLILSNLGQESDIGQARSAGAAGYLVKAELSLADIVSRVQAELAARPL
jgi:DNA-binding response OmpR family regulator